MSLTQIPFENMNSPYSEQLGKGFSQLRFGAGLEREFREFYSAICAPRGRIAGVAALISVLAVAALNALFGQINTDSTLLLLHIGVLCPLLTLFVTALHLKPLQKHYSRIAGHGVLILGLVVTYMSVSAMVNGNGTSYMFALTVLTNLFAKIFFMNFQSSMNAYSQKICAEGDSMILIKKTRLQNLPCSSRFWRN